MKVIDTRNVNNAVAIAIPYLIEEGFDESSRNGSVIVAPTPVMTVYNRPKEHVLFSKTRDANPFFHLFEALWMLAGRCDVAWPGQFNKRFKTWSDDGETIHGAYGYRWRRWFDFDQLAELIAELKRNPNTRRAVLTMWAPIGDLTTTQTMSCTQIGGLASKDVPCNTHAYFEIREGKLNMTVCNRSNDVIWGAYGANVVHFSLLLEYMAEQVGVPMGVYRQFSNNFHVYPDNYGLEVLSLIAEEAASENLYAIDGGVPTIPLNSTEPGWMESLHGFLNGAEIGENSFFNNVATPMYRAWFARKDGDYERAMRHILTMPECDWRTASREWILRKQKGKENAA